MAQRQIPQGFKLVSSSDPSPVVHPSDGLYPGENGKPAAQPKRFPDLNISVPCDLCFDWLMNPSLFLLLISLCSATSNGPKIFLDDSFTLAGTWCSRRVSSRPPLRHIGFLLRFSGPFLMLGPADTLEVPLADISLAPKLAFSLSLGEDTPPSVTTLSPHLQRHSDMQSFITFPWFNVVGFIFRVVSHPVFVIAAYVIGLWSYFKGKSDNTASIMEFARASGSHIYTNRCVCEWWINIHPKLFWFNIGLYVNRSNRV